MQLSQNARVLDAVVRMVVPMRREFGCSVDVQAFMRDAAYAQQVLGKALTSQVQRLRQYAEFAQCHLQPAAPASAAAAPVAAAAPPLTPQRARPPEFPGFAARRSDAVRRLLQLVGPVVEPLCIKMEKARTPDELAALLVVALRIVNNQRGAQAGRDYLAGISPGDAAAD